MTNSDLDSEIPPELLERIQEQSRLMTESWSKLAPVFQARMELFAAALRPAAEAAARASEVIRATQVASEKLGASIRDGLRRSYPPNWDPDRVRLRSIRSIVADDGIPIVWVPRAAIVAMLMAATSREERLGILRAREDEIVSDCRTCIADCSATDLADEAHFAKQALAAHSAGLDGPAQAMAVVIAERLITEHVAGGPQRGSYDRAITEAEFRDSMMMWELRRAAAIAPVVHFYSEWYPWSGQPPPPDLSRHVSVHFPTTKQYTRSNALLAMMLMVSLLREAAADLSLLAAAGDPNADPNRGAD